MSHHIYSKYSRKASSKRTNLITPDVNLIKNQAIAKQYVLPITQFKELL